MAPSRLRLWTTASLFGTFEIWALGWLLSLLFQYEPPALRDLCGSLIVCAMPAVTGATIGVAVSVLDDWVKDGRRR